MNIADKIGVSRQAVSKWESEQSVPDMDKVIMLSDYFEVTTDYILKGIEDKKQAPDPVNASVFLSVATALIFIGLIMSVAIWYEEQVAMAAVIGLIIMAVGCVVFCIGQAVSTQNVEKSKRLFWMMNTWLLAFIPLSFIYNMLFAGSTAPYPLLVNPPIAFPIFGLAYITLCLCVVLRQVKMYRKM